MGDVQYVTGINRRAGPHSRPGWLGFPSVGVETQMWTQLSVLPSRKRLFCKETSTVRKRDNPLQPPPSSPILRAFWRMDTSCPRVHSESELQAGLDDA